MCSCWLAPLNTTAAFRMLNSRYGRVFQGQSPSIIHTWKHHRPNRNRTLESQAETFRRTYAGMNLDLVIADNTEQLELTVQYRDKIFPGVPIVFIAVSSRELEGQRMWPGVTGVAVPVGLRETINLALHLHPDTNTVAVMAKRIE